MALLDDDILKRSLFNTYEIEIDDNIHIFVDLPSMARYSKLFYTILSECKEDSDVPKMIGSLKHWKIVHDICRENVFNYQFIRIGDKIKFFILLEYLIFSNDIINNIIKAQYSFTDNEILELPPNCSKMIIRNKIRVCNSGALFIHNFQKWTTVKHLVLDVLKDMLKDMVLDKLNFDVKTLRMESLLKGVYFSIPKDGIDFEMLANELDNAFCKK